MGKLREVFNDVFSRDRVEGAAMAASAAAIVLMHNPVALAGFAVIGAIMGKERLVETFNAAVNGRQMALQMVPAVAKRFTPG
ncbi:MAG: hypothetical protein ACAH80_09920 [Alphaproteobacteria bacterium]